MTRLAVDPACDLLKGQQSAWAIQLATVGQDTYEGEVGFFPAGELLAEDASRETPDGRGGVVLVWLPEDAGASVGQFFGLISRVIRGDVSGAAWAGATAVDIMTTKGDEFDWIQRSGKTPWRMHTADQGKQLNQSDGAAVEPIEAGDREKVKKNSPSGAVSHSHRLYSVFLYGTKDCATPGLTAWSRWSIKLSLTSAGIIGW